MPVVEAAPAQDQRGRSRPRPGGLESLVTRHTGQVTAPDNHFAATGVELHVRPQGPLFSILLLVITSVLTACSSGGSPAPSTSGASTRTTATGAATSPSSTTTSVPATQDAEPTLTAYSFKPGMISGGYPDLYTRLDAVVALPAGTGPHPVAVIVHGSYPGCIDRGKDALFTQDINTLAWPEACVGAPMSTSEGLTTGHDYVRATASFGYLAKELARRGIVAVAVDVNAKETRWGGEPNPQILQRNIVAAHLKILADINAGRGHGLPWAAAARGRLDLDRVALIGHSSGGEFVLTESMVNKMPGLRAVVALEPSWNSPISGATASPVPTLVVAGACDEQVGPIEPLAFARKLAALSPTRTVVTATLPHTTHIGLLSGGGSHRVGPVMPVSGPACAEGALWQPAQSRSQAAALTADFLAGAFGLTPGYALRTLAASGVTVNSLSPAVPVTTRDVATLPTDVTAASIAYAVVPEQILPPKPASLVITDDQGD